MSEEGKLQKLRLTRMVYFRAANNREKQITDITDSFDPKLKKVSNTIHGV